MTIDESRKVDLARDDRLRDATKEQPKPRPKESDFDKALEKSQMASRMSQQTQQQTGQKTVTEEAIKEAMRHEERQGDERRRDDDERKDGREMKQRGDRTDGRDVGGKVIAKGQLKQGSGGGGGREGGYGQTAGRRDVQRGLLRHAAKSLPVDLQGKFAAKLAQSIRGGEAQQAVLTQQVLNKIIQHVRIGLNRKGEKEIQIDLHERIFRGLKLRVTSQDGKVGVHFQTADAKGREALEKNGQAIREALAKKGIEVAELTVS